ncbi:MAG: hypothetical protein WCP43_06545, partial [Dehalococcoidia bacterium]
LTINNNETVNGTLTLTSGNIATGSNTVIIGSSGSVSRTSGHVSGNLRKYVETGATSKTFEIGATNYDPVTVDFSNVTAVGNLIAGVTSGQHTSIGSSTINSSKDVNVYWSLTNSGVSFDSYGVTLNFDSGDILGGADTDAFIIGKYNVGWTYPAVGTKTSTSTQATGVTSLGDFAVGEAKSNVATVTSTTYTVSAGGTATETIIYVPFGAAKATFLANLTKGQADQTWVSTDIANPVVTGNTLVVTAQDGTTAVTYTVTTGAEPSHVATVTSATYTVSTIGGGAETITNVPFGTAKATFLAAITKGQADQTWVSTAIADPVVTGNTLVVTAQDTTTVVTYTVTTGAEPSHVATVT